MEEHLYRRVTTYDDDTNEEWFHYQKVGNTRKDSSTLMTEEQERLVLQIVARLGEDTVHGEWPNQYCDYCPGESTGHYTSQSFTHHESCIILLIKELRRTLRERK